jgi:enterochelin esterase family protein
MRFSLLLAIAGVALAQEYTLGPDSERHDGVPTGTVMKHTWTSTVFPGTIRDYWVYVLAQYSPSKPACLMLFQDGEGSVRDDGAWRAPVVFDNVIHKGDIPVTIGVFINPGVLPALSASQQNRYNRS